MTPISKGALAIGNKLVLGAKTFRRGLVSSLDFGRQSINRTAEKINTKQKQVVYEKKRQKQLDRQIEETKDRKEREKLIEARKIGRPVTNIVQNTLKKPLEGFWKLVQAWAIANLPQIIKEINKFVLKVRIFGAAIKKLVQGVGTVFRGLTNVAKAALKNLSEFDFSDKSGRIKEAKEELEGGMDDIRANFDEAQNVWGREENELEEILRQLESGSTMQDAVAAMERNSGVSLEPQQSAVGPGSQSSSSGEYTGGAGDPQTGSARMRALLRTISFAEGTSGADGYNKWFGGRTDMDLSKMTINEVGAEMDRRNRTGENRYGRYASSAVGKYQMMNPEGAARAAGLDPAVDKFTPENQDKMVIAQYIKGQAGLTDAEIEGGITPRMIDKLAPVFASFPNLFGPDSKGRTGTNTSFYGQGGKSKEAITQYYNSSLSNASAQPQQPQPSASASSAFLTDNLYAKDFDTKDYGVPSQIIRTEDFGFIPSRGRHHNGVDFGTGGQRGWYCALLLNGKISHVGYSAGGGNMIFITAGNVEYCFMHLARKGKWRVGQKYTAGQPIEEVGETGKGTGIHLHLETRKPGSGPSGGFNPNPFVKYITFGKLRTRSQASAVSTTGTSESRSTEIASAAQSRPTGGTRTRNRTTVVRQKEIVMVG